MTLVTSPSCFNITCTYFSLVVKVEKVNAFAKQVDNAMRQKQEQSRLSKIINRIESYEAVEAPNEECARVRFYHLSMLTDKFVFILHSCSRWWLFSKKENDGNFRKVTHHIPFFKLKPLVAFFPINFTIVFFFKLLLLWLEENWPSVNRAVNYGTGFDGAFFLIAQHFFT